MTAKHRRCVVIGPQVWGELEDLANREEGSSKSSIIREALQDLFLKRKRTATQKRLYNPESDSLEG